MAGHGLLFAEVSVWLTSPWLISVGAAAGLVVLLVLYGVTALVSTRWAAFVQMSVREGILLPLLIFAPLLSGLARVGAPIVPYRSLLAAVARIPAVGASSQVLTVPPVNNNFAFPLPARASEMQSFELESDGTAHRRLPRRQGCRSVGRSDVKSSSGVRMRQGRAHRIRLWRRGVRQLAGQKFGG